LLKNILTDSHFAKRDRMGRNLGFLSRIAQDGWSAHPREIAVDERSAVLVEPDGSATIVGSGKGAYFLELTKSPERCSAGKPLTLDGVACTTVREIQRLTQQTILRSQCGTLGPV
jgi:cyanophycinase-like exopeptidase